MHIFVNIIHFRYLILVHQIHYLCNRYRFYCTNGTYNHICSRKLIDKVDYAELLLYQSNQIALHNQGIYCNYRNYYNL